MSKLETETSAAKTIQAYNDAASQIGLVLKPGDGIDNGDFPRHAYTNLRYIRRVNAVSKEHRKIIKTISRALVTQRDDQGKFTKKEVLWYTGDFKAINHRGIEYGTGFECGKFQKAKIVPNSNLTYNQKTGEPIGNEKRLAGQETVFEIEVPKTKEARKKLLDSIISYNDNHESAILYYYRELDQNNYEQYRDSFYCNRLHKLQH